MVQLVYIGLKEYLGCDGRHLQLMDQNNEAQNYSDYALYRVSEVPDELVYGFNMRILLTATVTLTAPKGGKRDHSLRGWLKFCTLVHQADNQFVLRLEQFKPEFRISKSVLTAENGHKDSDLEAFYDFVYEQIQDNYRDGFQQQMKGEVPKFGFQLEGS